MYRPGQVLAEAFRAPDVRKVSGFLPLEEGAECALILGP